MTVKELCELDERIIALQIEIRNPTRLQRIIEIGHTICDPRYDKFISKDGEIEHWEDYTPQPTPRTIIRRTIQRWFNPEFTKNGQFRGRFTGTDLKQIPKELQSLTITNLYPCSGTFFDVPVESTHIGFHGYILWCLPNGFADLDNISARNTENPENVTIDDLIGAWERRMSDKT